MNLPQKLARRHEKEINEQIPGSYQTIASGNQHEKGDVSTYKDGTYFQCFVECKATQRKSYALTNELVEQVKRQALSKGIDKRPAIAIRFYEEGEQSVEQIKVLNDVVVMPLDDYLELLELAKSNG